MTRIPVRGHRRWRGWNWTALSTEIDAAECRELAERFGTPFFLYDADAVNRRIDLVPVLEGLVKVFYAVKANPNLELLRAVGRAADRLDISSGGELEQAALAGFDMANLSFAGPARPGRADPGDRERRGLHQHRVHAWCWNAQTSLRSWDFGRASRYR
jgi:hypothetical protein